MKSYKTEGFQQHRFQRSCNVRPPSASETCSSCGSAAVLMHLCRKPLLAPRHCRWHGYVHGENRLAHDLSILCVNVRVCAFLCASTIHISLHVLPFAAAMRCEHVRAIRGSVLGGSFCGSGRDASLEGTSEMTVSVQVLQRPRPCLPSTRLVGGDFWSSAPFMMNNRPRRSASKDR